MLPLLHKTWVKFSVPVERSVDANLIPRAELTDASLEKILFDRPAHQVVLNGRLSDLFVQFNGLVVILAI